MVGEMMELLHGFGLERERERNFSVCVGVCEVGGEGKQERLPWKWSSG